MWSKSRKIDDPGKYEKSVGIVILVEPGKLEWQFVILVSSLIAHCYDSFRIYAYCRSDRIKKLRPQTLEFAARWSIDIIPLENPFHDGYPQGNKIVACAAKRSEKWTVFLDTDTAMMRPARFLDTGRPGHIGIVPVRKKTWCSNIDDWKRLFASFGCSFTHQ